MAIAEMARPLGFGHDLQDESAEGPPAARTKRVAVKVRELLASLGLDLLDPNLAGTPDRMARAYQELLELDPLLAASVLVGPKAPPEK